MKNSPSAQSLSNIKVQTKIGSTLIDQGFGQVTFFARDLPSGFGSLTPQDPTVGVFNSLTLRVTIQTPVQNNGQVLLVVPKWDTLNRQSMVNQLSGCRSNLQQTSVNPTCITSLGATTDTVTITNALSGFSGNLPTGKIIEITLNNFRNPPTLSPISTFQIFTADTLGNLIENCTGLTLSLVNPGTLNSLSSVTLQGNTGINQMGTYSFNFKLGNPMPALGWIRIIFPTDVTVLSPVYNAQFQISSSATITQSTQSINGVSKTFIDIKNGISSYVQEGSALIFQITGIRNPPSTKATNSFEFYTADANNWIDKVSTGLTVSATQGQLRTVKIYPSDNTGVLSYARIYQLQFTTSNPLTSANSISIKFPSASFAVSTRTCTVNGTYSSQTFPTSYLCAASSDTQMITIKNFLTSTIQQSTFILTIQGLYIRNPATVSESSAIEVYTSLDGFRVDYDNSQKITATWSPINSASIVSNSYQTNKEDVTYIMTIVPSGYLVTTAVINITFPDEVTIYDENKLSRQCGLDKLSGFKNSGGLDCQVKNGNQLIIKSGFNIQQSDDPPTMVISLPGLRNPRMLNKPTSSFTVSIYDGVDQKKLLYNISSGITVTMGSLGSIISAQITRISQTNGELTNFTFRFQFSNLLQSGDYLILETPNVNPVTFSNTTQCYGISANLFYNQECILVSFDQLKIKLSTRYLRRRILQGTQFSAKMANIIVSNIYNPSSVQKTGSFVVTQYNSQGFKVEMSTQNITIQNNQTAELKYSQVSILPISFQTGSQTPYAITFSPTNYVQDMYLIIQVPIELKISQQVSCEALNGVNSDIQCEVQGRNVTVKKAFSSQFKPKLIKFSIQNLTNPDTEIQTGNFKFFSYTADGFSLDFRDKDLYLDFNCNLPCKTCIPKNNTGCQTCFTDSLSLSKGLPKHLLNNYCIDTCPLFYYSSVKDYSCQKCYDNKNCLKCKDGEQKSCLECTKEYTLVSGTCVKLSDQTYFYPILVLSIIWMLASIFITLNWEKSRYLTTVILGLSILEFGMLAIELAMQKYYSFNSNFSSSLIYGVALQYPANVLFLIFYLVLLRNLEEVRESRTLDKKLHFAVIAFSGALSSRAFKLLYSNLGNKPYLSMESIFSQAKIRRTYYIIQLVSMLCSVLLVLNAINNWGAAASLNLKFPTYIDLERTLVSSLLCLMMILELIYLERPRPQFVDDLISKYHGQEPQPRQTKITPQTLLGEEKVYNEVPSMSFVTQQDGPMQSAEEVKRDAMKQVLSNLKVIKPELVEQKLQELIEDRQRNSPLRKSEQKLPKTGRKGDYAQCIDEGEDDRRVVTEPLTPKTVQKMAGERGILEEMAQQQAFPMDPRLKRDMKDQEVAAMRNSIDREWEELQREKEQLVKMKEEFEQEKARFKNSMMEEHKKSGTVSSRASSEKILEEVNRKEINTHRSKNQMLDAVRESQSELLEETGGRRGRQKTVSKERQSKIHNFSGSRESLSIKSEGPSRMSPNPHRCHGQSQSTIKSINNLRKKTGSSKSGSINGSHQVSRFQQHPNDQMFTSPRNLQQYLNSNLDDHQIQPEEISTTNNQQRNTKIYYSDKTESSVEELMDETPSTYNIHNGRFEGRSQGGNSYIMQNNQQHKKIITRINGIDSKQASQKKKRKKLFREETTQELETVEDNQVDSRSHSVLKGRLPVPDQNSRALSNMSFEQNQHSMVTLKKKRGSLHSNRVDGVIPMSNDRIKALEAAYLTKLQRPKKQTPKSRMFNQEQMDRNYTEIINVYNKNMSSRNGGQLEHVQSATDMMGLTQMKVLPVPQINNFN